MVDSFDTSNFNYYCDLLAEKDADLKNIITQYGYSPFWSRNPSFATLIHIILEQQVSLTSAKAAFLKLEATIGHITPEKILQLSDDEMKACYFSRQKMVYARHLAEAIMNKELSIDGLKILNDEEVSSALKKIKGIGNWTVDVYLMMVLHRLDCFPTGDVALIKSIKEVKALPAHTSKEEILIVADAWKPYRTIAAYLLWHGISF
jgi:DNA-3-methyladenine glycosylase II